MEIFYVNSNGERIDLVNWPYKAQTGDILDYSWEYVTSNYGRITGFERGVKEKFITLTIKGNTVKDFAEAVDHLHRMTERDIVLNNPGKLYVNSSYMQGFIYSSAKEDWEGAGQTGTMDTTLRFVTDRPQWVEEAPYSFPSSAYMNFEEYMLPGETDEYLVSLGEKAPITLSVTREIGNILHYTINTGAIAECHNFFDVLFKKGDTWGVQKRTGLEIVNLETYEKLNDGYFVTYRKTLDQGNQGIYMCSHLNTVAQPISPEDLTPVDYQEGTEVVSTLSEMANAYVRIWGTAQGVKQFTLVSVRNKDAARNSYGYLSQYTHDHLVMYTYEQLQQGIDECGIVFNLSEPLGESDYIFRDSDGKWKIDRNGERTELSEQLQKQLNNFTTYAGETTIYCEGDQPYLEVEFQSEEYYANVLNGGEALRFPAEEFAHFEDNTLYIRLRHGHNIQDLRLLYVLTTEEFVALDSADQQKMQEIEEIDDIKRIILDGDTSTGGNDFGVYPHGFPWDYADNTTSKEIINDAIGSSPFQLTIYGKCVDPEIRIGGHLYKLIESLDRGDYAIIDSKSKTITKHLANGEQENIYHSRFKEQSIFQPIKEGINEVYWNETFGFDITLISERSEPAWN